MARKTSRGGFQLPNDPIKPKSPAPKLSQDTDHWLRELGYSAEEIAELRSKGVI
jgi:CoA:oxalate CoA-transferase